MPTTTAVLYDSDDLSKPLIISGRISDLPRAEDAHTLGIAEAGTIDSVNEHNKQQEQGETKPPLVSSMVVREDCTLMKKHRWTTNQRWNLNTMQQGRGFVLHHGGAVSVHPHREPVLPVLRSLWRSVRKRRVLRRVSCAEGKRIDTISHFSCFECFGFGIWCK